LNKLQLFTNEVFPAPEHVVLMSDIMKQQILIHKNTLYWLQINCNTKI